VETTAPGFGDVPRNLLRILGVRGMAKVMARKALAATGS
jgi:hypothetical protein